MELVQMKKKFEECLSKKKQKSNSFQMNHEKYNKLVEEVKAAKSGNSIENRRYWLLKHYDVVTVGGKEYLIVPIVNDQVLYYITNKDLFDILSKTHESIGHGGRDRMKNELKQRYKNITLYEIQTFLNLCEPCLQKRKSEKKGLVIKPMILWQFNSRCQVDLIDYQSQADGEFKFIMVYQDHLTKYVVLRALRSKKAEEVAKHVLDIFLLFGAPTILQSDNGREFCNHIIEDLKVMWPELKIVHGKPRHSQSQGSVERANQGVENMLTTWMQDNHCNNWSKGLPFIQFMKNRSLHAGIKRSPYEAMFGQPPKVGLTSSTLRKDTIDDINTEEELEQLLAGVQIFEEENESEDCFLQEEEEGEDFFLPAEESAETVYQPEEEKEEYIINDQETLQLMKHCDICYKELEFAEKNICALCSKSIKIKTTRNEAKENLEAQAKRMKRISDASHPEGEIGMTVRVRVPDVDRGRGEARSILATILKKTEDGYFQLGTKNGVIKGLYARSQFSTCPEKVLSIENIPLNQELPLRTVATHQAIGSGQGFTKCHCKTKCSNMFKEKSTVQLKMSC